jgi:hypothetical protein
MLIKWATKATPKVIANLIGRASMALAALEKSAAFLVAQSSDKLHLQIGFFCGTLAGSYSHSLLIRYLIVPRFWVVHLFH